MNTVLACLAEAAERSDTLDPLDVARAALPRLQSLVGLEEQLTTLAASDASDVGRPPVCRSRMGPSSHVERFLRGIPEAIRHAWMRSQDPAGMGPPPGFALETHYDLLKLLPDATGGTCERLGQRDELRLSSGQAMTFAWCPPGTFRMGSELAVRLDTREVPHHFELELPVHAVTLTRGFYAAVHPVTRGQFTAFASDTGYRSEAETGGGGWKWEEARWVQDPKITWRNPGYPQSENDPVTVVSWNDARVFAHWLRDTYQRPVRLPTEAEWEYACRAGTVTEYHFGDVPSTHLLNYDGDYTWNGSPRGEFRRRTTPVGSFSANAWGLFDMHGNVWEWCADWFDPAFYGRSPKRDPVCRDSTHRRRVYRGGSWFNNPAYCRAAYRHSASPGHRHNYLGIRVLFTAD